MSKGSAYACYEHSPNPSLTPDTEDISTLASPPTLYAEQEDQVEELFDTIHVPVEVVNLKPLTSTDIRANPILASIESTKISGGDDTPKTKGGFKAKPAPVLKDHAGPRMTKAAALRLGLDWESMKPRRELKERQDQFKETPGCKRTGLGITVASLAAPSITPRQTKSSQLRTGVQPSIPKSVKHDPEAIASAMKARSEAEKALKEQRRKSIALPASLATPSITPRQNRSSMLRTGVKSPGAVTSPSLSSSMASLTLNGTPIRERLLNSPSLKTANSELKLTRRSTVQSVKSLGSPSITPRLNKSALLRAPHSSHASIPTSPSSSKTSQKPVVSSVYEYSPRPRISVSAAGSYTGSSGINRTLATQSPGLGPKPTKSSLLRQAQGAKVPKSLSIAGAH